MPSPYSTSLSRDWFHFHFFERLNAAIFAIVIGQTFASFGRSVRFLAEFSRRSTPKPVRGQSAKPVALQQFFGWPVLGLIAQSGNCAFIPPAANATMSVSQTGSQISTLVQKQTNAGMFMHQSTGNSFQFLYQSGTANPQLLGRTGLIVVINREGTS